MNVLCVCVFLQTLAIINYNKYGFGKNFQKKDFGSKDLGIDLVAKTDVGDYWAIQCKCYDEKTVISKEDVDSFLTTSSRTFIVTYTFQTTVFRERIWISTTNHWGVNAEKSIQNQNPKVTRIAWLNWKLRRFL